MLEENRAFNFLLSLVAAGCERSPAFSWLLRNVTFRGKGRIVMRLHSDAMAREVTVTNDGIRYCLDLRDDVQRELYFRIYEVLELETALELIPVGGTCLDIGANNGAFALQFARKVGHEGIVHAFEPDAEVFSRLVRNCHLNGFESVLKCHRIAVSNATGHATLFKSEPRHSGWGSLQQFKDIVNQTETVPTVTLDDFLARERIRHIDFLKVDIEAQEPEFLEGASKALRDQIFRYVLIEFNGIRLGERGKTLNDFLAPILNNGYVEIDFRVPRLSDLISQKILPETVCTTFLFSKSHPR